ncbi:MAG: hypothetical protein OXE43_13765 [Chloroflexi bacterium]|nr:hypothetical protein [Chloroflexota bacterium]
MTAPDFRDSPLGSPGQLAHEISPEIEQAILQLVVDGFERWQLGGFKRFGDHEDHYTVRLVACMSEIRRERNMALVPRYQYVEASDEMLQGREDPAHAPRIDMVIARDSFAEDAYLSIECKRLALDDLARRYVVDGLDKFVRGYYGAEAQTGAMVGYVISGTADALLMRINARVEEAPRMGSSHTLVPADPIGWLDNVFSSNHARFAPLQAIRITHLLFDMREVGPSP